MKKINAIIYDEAESKTKETNVKFVVKDSELAKIYYKIMEIKPAEEKQNENNI